jgi:hypothetical protein
MMSHGEAGFKLASCLVPRTSMSAALPQHSAERLCLSDDDYIDHEERLCLDRSEP